MHYGTLDPNLAIAFQNVFFEYGTDLVLSDISFEIRAGEFVGIFGPNGGGKTTLLRLIAGLLQPKKGLISVFGTPPKKARKKIGYVPQANGTDKRFPVTAQEVVESGCLSKTNFWGILPKSFKKKAIEALNLVGMGKKIHSPFGSLSGGEAQRVLIARALVSDPELLLLDEPTASVDPKAEEEILSLLSSLQGTLSIVMITHDLQTILQKVDKLLCVHGTVHTLPPSRICEHYGLGLYHSPLLQPGTHNR